VVGYEFDSINISLEDLQNINGEQIIASHPSFEELVGKPLFIS